MILEDKIFVSYIESRIQKNNELYARFHLGSFAAGQSLTIANALRRTLLSELPGLVITKASIHGVRHEFDSIEDIQENILDVVLNIKNIVLTSTNLNPLEDFVKENEFKAYINYFGPGKITARDIEFPVNIQPVFPDTYIATCSNFGKLKATLYIKYIDPIDILFNQTTELRPSQNELILNSIPKPVRQVNYSIQKISNNPNTEYISLEIWTDGSLDPSTALQYTLEKLTKIFFSFTKISKELNKPIFIDNESN